jgi:hypothetical protein
MLKIFKFFRSDSGEAKVLSMRARFELAVADMNAVLAGMGEMPKMTIDANARKIEFSVPDQFPDEALALPAPQPADLADNDGASDGSKSASIKAADSESAEKADA